MAEATVSIAQEWTHRQKAEESGSPQVEGSVSLTTEEVETEPATQSDQPLVDETAELEPSLLDGLDLTEFPCPLVAPQQIQHTSPNAPCLPHFADNFNSTSEQSLEKVDPCPSSPEPSSRMNPRLAKTTRATTVTEEIFSQKSGSLKRKARVTETTDTSACEWCGAADPQVPLFVYPIFPLVLPSSLDLCSILDPPLSILFPLNCFEFRGCVCVVFPCSSPNPSDFVMRFVLDDFLRRSRKRGNWISSDDNVCNVCSITANPQKNKILCTPTPPPFHMVFSAFPFPSAAILGVERVLDSARISDDAEEGAGTEAGGGMTVTEGAE